MDNSTEKTLDLKLLCLNLLKHYKFIIFVTLIITAGSFFITKFFITEKYTAIAQVYVDPRNDVSSDSQSSQLNYNDLTAAEKLVNTCQILFTGDKMAECVITNLKNYKVEGYSISEIKSMVTVEAATTGTSIMNIKVVTADPQLSTEIAKIIQEKADEVYTEIVKGGSVSIVNEPLVPTQPSSPNVPRNVALGFIIGFVFACAVITILEMVDTKIKPSDDLEQMYGVPLFAEILDFEANVKGGYQYEYK